MGGSTLVKENLIEAARVYSVRLDKISSGSANAAFSFFFPPLKNLKRYSYVGEVESSKF